MGKVSTNTGIFIAFKAFCSHDFNISKTGILKSTVWLSLATFLLLSETENNSAPYNQWHLEFDENQYPLLKT